MSTAPASAPTMSSADWAALILLSFLWGGTFLFAKVAVAEIPPLTLVAARVAIAALAILIVLRANGLSLSGHKVGWAAFLGMGILNNVIPFSLIFLGQRDLSAGVASILNATTPLFTVLVLHLFTKDERATPMKTVGVVLGFLGVMVLMGPEAIGGLGREVVAQLLILGAAISYGFALLWGRRFRGTPPMVGAAGQLSASALVMAPVALVADQPWTLPTPSLAAIGSVLAMAVFSTALAYILYFRIMARAGGVNAALVTLLIPGSAILLGALVLGERLDLLDGIGLAIILLGLVVIDGRLPRMLMARARGAGQA